MSKRPRVAVFRPADERIEQAQSLLSELGVETVADPMLELHPTGNSPRTDAEYTILTSKTGAELVAEMNWRSDGLLCAIGDPTADALEAAGYDVDIVPETFSSTGLVNRLAEEVSGARIEVARSNHGSPVLLDGLEAAGAYLHETVLYELTRPPTAGISAEHAANGALDGALFTSSLTVTHFCEAATERGVGEEAIAGLNAGVVGAIGQPTAETARKAGIDVAVVPDDAEFESLARAVVSRLR